MTQSHSSKPSGAPGTKTLITAASLAITLGGWALLTLRQADAATASPTLQPPVPTEPVTALNLPPLPTIVPPPAQTGASGGQPLNSAGSQPAVAAAPQPAPALRVVSAPPPVTNTQTSRP